MLNRNKTLLLLAIMLVITLYSYFHVSYTPLSKQKLAIALFFTLITLSIYAFSKERTFYLKSNYFKISTIFVIGYVLVHFFEYLAYVVGAHDKIIDIEYVDSKYINEAAFFSCACLAVYFMGYVFEMKPFKSQKSYKSNSIFLEFFMLICLVIFYFSAGSYYFNGGYGDVLNNIGLSLPAILSQTSLQASQVAIAMIVVYNRQKKLSVIDYIKQFSFIYYFTLLLYSYLVMSSGDRGPLFQAGICYITPYFLINKIKLKPIPAAILISVSALFFALLGTVRAMDGGLSVEKFEKAQEFRSQRFEGESIVFTSTAELSNVVRAYHVLYDFTREHGTIYGLGLGNQLLGIIPGLRLLIYPLFGIDDKEVTTAVVTTNLLDKDHGMGSTCVGDTLFNFGIWGTLPIFFLFGMFVRKMDLSSYENINCLNPFWCCTIITYFMFAIYIGRGYLTSPINLLAYSWFFFLLNYKFCKTHV